jgi:hypothetical protein
VYNLIVKVKEGTQRGGNVMRVKNAQMSLFDTYKDVSASFEEDKPLLFRRLDEHNDWDGIIPARFYAAFYRRTGRPRDYPLVGFIKGLVLQKVFGYTNDSLLLVTLRHSREMREFCGFRKVPDAAKLTRFKQDFLPYITDLFEGLVELTEPICRAMDAELADELIFDTTGIESQVAENNPKFFHSKLSQAKAFAKANPEVNPYKMAYGLLPDHARANPAVKQQYINGHFCYAQKAGFLTNGMGIVRHIALFDDDFKAAHPEIMIGKRSDNPDADKEIGDAKALLPILRDFRAAHPSLAYSTFMGDSSFDSYDLYSALLGEYGFSRAIIPMNPRSSTGALTAEFNESGIPLCPADNTPMRFRGFCGGKNRSRRIKFICPKSECVRSFRSTTWLCRCQNPCSPSPYGRSVYVYPDADKRLYPGILRNTTEWDALYKRRTQIERSISSFKTVLGIQHRKTFNTATTKADLLLAGIVQLLCVVLAGKLHDTSLLRRVRKLAA